MKHPSTREYFAYWDKQRGDARAPERADIAPDAVRALLGDIFILAADEKAGFPFRVAGTRVCALLGGDQKQRSFMSRFAADAQRDVRTMLCAVADEVVGVVAGLNASTAGGARTHLELLLLPLAAKPHSPVSLTGLITPFDDAGSAINGAVGPLQLTSWRYLAPTPRPLGPRLLRKLAVARGLMVYEGLR